MPKLSFTQQGLVALVHEIGGLVVGFGVVNNTTAGVWITVAVSAVNLGYLLAGALHRHADVHLAAANVAAKATTTAASTAAKATAIAAATTAPVTTVPTTVPTVTQ